MTPTRSEPQSGVSTMTSKPSQTDTASLQNSQPSKRSQTLLFVLAWAIGWAVYSFYRGIAVENVLQQVVIFGLLLTVIAYFLRR